MFTALKLKIAAYKWFIVFGVIATLSTLYLWERGNRIEADGKVTGLETKVSTLTETNKQLQLDAKDRTDGSLAIAKEDKVTDTAFDDIAAKLDTLITAPPPVKPTPAPVEKKAVSKPPAMISNPVPVVTAPVVEEAVYPEEIDLAWQAYELVTKEPVT